MTNYIYTLYCPIADTVRYVGKTTNPEKRLKSHVSAARTNAYKHHTSAWIRKLLSVGLEPHMEIIETVPEGESWQEAERAWIAKALIKGWRLTNSTAGGEGLDYICPKAAAVYRANLSAAMTELWNRPERRKEAQLRSIAAWADPEVTARRKASQEAARATPETKARYRESGKEIGSRPAVKNAKSIATTSQWANPETREARMRSLQAPEVKAKQSAAKIALWESPEGRAKMMAVHTPERRAHQAKLLADPARKAKIDAARNSEEYKAKRAATIREKWLAKNAHLSQAELEAALTKNDKATAKREEQKAAKLAAILATPYTESS